MTWQRSARLNQIISPNTVDDLIVYAGLFAECQMNASQLADLLNHEEWQQSLADTIDFANQRLGRPGTTPEFVAIETLSRHNGLTDSSAGLVRCAGVLKALDSWYHQQQGRIRYRIATLPGSPAIRYLFMPTPDNRANEWVPEALKLKRGESHYDNKVEFILDLWWRLVRFGDEAAHGIVPIAEELLRSVERDLEQRLAANGTLRVAVAAPFCDRRFPVDEADSRPHQDGRVPFRFCALPDTEVALAMPALDGLLDACATGRVDILCLPELTVDPGLQRRLQQRLASSSRSARPALVVAGSYHVPVAGRQFNRCHVYDGQGELLWHQDKLTPFGTVPGGTKNPGGIEDIDRGERLRFVDASFARLSTPICLDFLAIGAIYNFFRDAGVNLFLVPAMSAKLEEFERRAREHGKWNRAFTVVANSGQIPGMDLTPPAGIAYVPVRRGNGLVTDRVECQGALRIYDLAEILRALGVEEENRRVNQV